mmetsp:Transcript_50858/g.135784  ORF Transcript_50858/g.135784 Transcript_50858/m.135784 type:complete len:459 (-) Transcript_50858:36-1412(-)
MSISLTDFRAVPLAHATEATEHIPDSSRICRRNIRMMYAFQILCAVSDSVARGPIFDMYLFYLGGHVRTPFLPLHGRNSIVGFSESVSGIASLILAIPVGLLVDRHPQKRARLLRLSTVAGVASVVFLLFAAVGDNLLLWFISLILVGAFSTLSGTASEAIFADSIPQGERSGLFTTKLILTTVSSAVGPALAGVGMFFQGDNWELHQMKSVIVIGAMFLPVSCVALYFFEDPPVSVDEQSNADVTLEETTVVSNDTRSLRCCCFDKKSVPFLLAAADFVTCVGAGMTVKFFNLFFIKDLKFAPSGICGLQTAYPLVISVFMKVTHCLSKPFGRPLASLLFFSTNVVCLVLLSQVTNVPLLLALFLLRGGVANSTYAIDRSILVDFTPSSHRGRWSAVESLTSMTWSGSAVLGGVLADSHDYRFTFLVTSTLYAVACFIYSPLVGLVPRQESEARTVT